MACLCEQITGREIELSPTCIGRRWIFRGENVFAEEGRYPVSAHCLEKALTCGFSRRQFEQLILKHPDVGLQIIKNLSERFAWLTSRVGRLAVTNIEDRLYRPSRLSWPKTAWAPSLGIRVFPSISSTTMVSGTSRSVGRGTRSGFPYQISPQIKP